MTIHNLCRKRGKIALCVGIATILLIAVSYYVLVLDFARSCDDASYCENMLKETGLDFEKYDCKVEEKFCENAWVDASVFYKLLIKGVSEADVLETIKSYHQCNSGITLNSSPPWWKPDASYKSIKYYRGDSGFPVILIYFKQYEQGLSMYVAILP